MRHNLIFTGLWLFLISVSGTAPFAQDVSRQEGINAYNAGKYSESIEIRFEPLKRNGIAESVVTSRIFIQYLLTADCFAPLLA